MTGFKAVCVHRGASSVCVLRGDTKHSREEIFPLSSHPKPCFCFLYVKTLYPTKPGAWGFNAASGSPLVQTHPLGRLEAGTHHGERYFFVILHVILHVICVILSCLQLFSVGALLLVLLCPYCLMCVLCCTAPRRQHLFWFFVSTMNPGREPKLNLR